jgi:hypothetical protein
VRVFRSLTCSELLLATSLNKQIFENTRKQKPTPISTHYFL